MHIIFKVCATVFVYSVSDQKTESSYRNKKNNR